MKIIIEIGHTKFLMPPSANVNAVLQVLSKAILVDEDHRSGRTVYLPAKERPYSVPIKVEMIEDHQFLDPKKRKAIPEKASPDAHNSF